MSTLNELQENYNRRPLSPWQEAPRSRDRLCPVALAIASFIVLLVVLTVAGLALYMGALHSEFSSPLVAFSCSIKVLRGDRFVGAFQEKARRYSSQLETLYKKSTLGPALIECNVDRFGEDTYTIYFTLTFDRKRMPRSNVPIEKSIADVISADILSKKPIFKSVRFAPGSMRIQEVNLGPTYNTKVASPNESRKRGGVVLKSPLMKNISLAISSTKKKIATSPQGSFKITKTEADITEKQDLTNGKAKLKSHTDHTSIPKILKTLPPIQKVNQSRTETSSVHPRTSVMTSTNVVPIITLEVTSKPLLQTQTEATTAPFIKSDLFDKAPWTPMIFNKSDSSRGDIEIRSNNKSRQNISNNNERKKKYPIYTSFTNPSLTIFQKKTNPLAVTNVKGHPLPVNKIEEITEPIIRSTIKFEEIFPNIPMVTSGVEKITKNSVQIDNGKNNASTDVYKRYEKIRNISSIFHDLVASMQDQDKTLHTKTTLHSELANNFSAVAEGIEDMNFGQGQVEVVDVDEDLLIKATTKIPLVTLLPAKSNSGVGKPLRKRPFRKNVTTSNQDERGFGEITHLENTEIQSEPIIKETKNYFEDFKIVGMLNFAPEKMEDESATEYVRRAKMESSTKIIPLNNDFMMFFSNFSTFNKHEPNVLTPERIKLLSEISKIYDDNNTKSTQESVISTKAVRPVHAVNSFGFKSMNKYLNKVVTNDKKESTMEILNPVTCGKDDITCGDGECLSKYSRCNHLRDCPDGRDEQNCTCADYLRTQYLNKKICDGIIDCWDFSDEHNCEWCRPDQHICTNSKSCIDKEKVCDGVKDCLEGDDERKCLNVGKNLDEAEHFTYHSEGSVMVRKFGVWGTFCVDNLHQYYNTTSAHGNIDDLGEKICRSLTYNEIASVSTLVHKQVPDQMKFYELILNKTEDHESSWLFEESSCTQRRVLQVKCESLECGIRPEIVKHTARIVGGKNAGTGSWPWQAALYKEGEFQCGGSLLSNRWIISAGHCFYKSQEYWVARLGALRRSTVLPSPYEQLKPIQKIFIHPGYENNGFVNDIALLRMKTSVTFSDYIRPVCLPKLEESLEDDVQCTILGWGQLSEVGRIFPDTLQEVQLPVISTSECRKRTVFLPLYNITEEMFCAGYDRGGRDACLGDSGGPLICPEENGRWVIHGITSNGYGCARANRPGVYTKVSSYIKWIQDYLTIRDTDDSLTSIERKNHKCSGHRCPLGQCLPKSQICNGYTECSDGSDEVNC
ncbi:hypothetical protein WA026_004663 [Henosepilachna vigintioctopunctata]|uniref:Peptidase S1 domain-containing protein n=1 Tax=Henosepilachna vigintioctopunctata TaxID=420089 RepID=A0AAW1V8B3_9CUCU